MKKSKLLNEINNILTHDYDLDSETLSEMIVKKIEEIGMLPPSTKVYKKQSIIDDCGTHYIVEEMNVWDNE